MRWTPGGRSRNLEDRRGQRGGRGFAVGGGIGIGGLLLLLVLSLVTGQDFLGLLGGGGGGGAPAPSGPPPDTTPEEENLVQFVSFVLDDAQATWAQIFPSLGTQYQDARLVVFRDATESGCGFGQAATGPFYCPADQKVYIDLSFYQELERRFGAPGDFAQAYVIAHEIGHHVQTLLGISSKVSQLQQSEPRRANEYSVALELQADCFAGVWGHATAQRDVLESGDVEEGLNAAAAIGDDRLQQASGGRVAPESFTHGSSEQRVAWFRRGLTSGDPRDCDTFGTGR
jgi:uncharacterized protein